MSVCSGASQVKAGIATSIVVDPSFAKNLFPASLSWLYDYVPLMRAIQIGDVPSFCAADPPTFTVPTVAELFQFITAGPIGQNDAVQTFLANLTKALLWYNLCECASGTPTALTQPTKPADLPAINPFPTVTPNSATPCRTITYTHTSVNQAGGGGWVEFTVKPSLFGVSATYLRVTFTQKINGTDATPTKVSYAWTYDASDPATSGTAVPVQPSPANRFLDFGPSFGTYVLPATQTQLRVVLSEDTSVTGTLDNTITFDFYCGGQSPTNNVTPCCPPDVIASGLLRQILSQVTLLQRQVAPFAYVYGANHTGLSGNGELAVQGLIGASVDITTLPSSVGSSVGTPETLYDVGYLTFGTDDGWVVGQRIDYDGTLALPQAAGSFTRLGFTLRPGVVVSIRELVREP